MKLLTTGAIGLALILQTGIVEAEVVELDSLFVQVASKNRDIQTAATGLQQKIKDLEAQLAQAKSDLAAKQAELDATVTTDANHIAVLQADIASRQAQIDAKEARINKLVSAMPAPQITSITAIPPEITTQDGTSHVIVTGQFLDTCSPGLEFDIQAQVGQSSIESSIDCLGLNGFHIMGKAVVAVNIPIPPPPPTPTPTPTPTPSDPSANTLKSTNVSGTDITNYPFRIGRPFVCGEIPHAPQFVINNLALPTQADVKNRCEDGSVKFAVLSTVIPTLPNGVQTVLTIKDQPSSNNSPVSSADILAQFPDFDAGIILTNPANGNTVSASARKMLSDGACRLWTSGSIAQTMICDDLSAARKYDMGFSPARAFQPRFIITFWLQTRQVLVEYVGEVGNSKSLEAFLYDLELTTGLANPTAVYTQTGIRHSIATRWIQRTWIGGTPEHKVNIDHNIGYLADTKWFPNFDRTLRIPETVTTAAYAGWVTANRSIGAAGYWNKAMPNTGYQTNIGPMPLWMNRVLFGGDWRNWEIALTQADLAGSWSMQVRQGDPTKFADPAKKIPGQGLPIDVYSNPSLWLFDGRAIPTVADALNIVSPSGAGGSFDLYGWNGWQRDGAHQPHPFSTMYLLTGDPVLLEGLQLWAAANSLNTNPGGGYLGRSGPYTLIYDQVRGEGWTLWAYADAAAYTPDNDPMRSVFTSMIDDALGRWMGKYGINGTKYDGTPTFKIGRQYVGTSGDGFRGLGPSPLGWWSYDGYGKDQMNPTYFDMTVALSAQAPWQQDFITLALGHAAELGFATDRLLAFAGQNVVGRMTGGTNPFLVSEYIRPDVKVNGQWFATWAEELTGWMPKYQALSTLDPGAYWPNIGMEIYWDVARGTLGMLYDKVPGAPAAWLKMNEVVATTITATGQSPDWNKDPTWAIVPRTLPSVK